MTIPSAQPASSTRKTWVNISRDQPRFPHEKSISEKIKLEVINLIRINVIFIVTTTTWSKHSHCIFPAASLHLVISSLPCWPTQEFLTHFKTTWCIYLYSKMYNKYIMGLIDKKLWKELCNVLYWYFYHNFTDKLSISNEFIWSRHTPQ